MSVFHGEGLRKVKGLRFRRDRSGLWTGTQVYTCMKDDFGAVVPAQGSPHEDFPFMRVDEIEDAEFLEKGLVKLSVKYAGALGLGGGSDVAPEPEYSLDVTTSDEPLATHPRYEDLDAFDISEAVELALNPPKEDDGESLKEIDTAGWPANKLELYEKTQAGVEAYRDPKVIWSKKWVDDSLPSGLNQTGEIDTPSGNPPTVASNRNWMYLGARTRIRGRVYEIEESWELSGRGGWDEDLYVE